MDKLNDLLNRADDLLNRTDDLLNRADGLLNRCDDLLSSSFGRFRDDVRPTNFEEAMISADSRHFDHARGGQLYRFCCS